MDLLHGVGLDLVNEVAEDHAVLEHILEASRWQLLPQDVRHPLHHLLLQLLVAALDGDKERRTKGEGDKIRPKSVISSADRRRRDQRDQPESSVDQTDECHFQRFQARGYGFKAFPGFPDQMARDFGRPEQRMGVPA